MGCQDLKNNNLHAFGQKMYSTHNGLSKEYEVSCIEMDFMVKQALETKAVAGSRMMGGGFGGCTINFIKTNAVDSFVSKTSEAYFPVFGKHPLPIPVTIEDGTSIIKAAELPV